jgi:ferredoxin-nitrite reductase
VAFESLGSTLEAMLKGYLDKRSADESFHAFCNRHTVGELQVVFDAAA